MNQFYTYTEVFAYPEEEVFFRYKALSRNKTHHVLLESGRTGRYHIIGLQPFKIVEGKNSSVFVQENGDVSSFEGNILDILQIEMEKYKSFQLPEIGPFQGGAIGYFSYDCAKYIEKLPDLANDDLGIPDMIWLFFRELYLFDKQTNQVTVLVLHKENEKEWAKDRAMKMKEEWLRNESDEMLDWGTYPSYENKSFNEQEFSVAVEKIKNYITAGDVFQVNLSVRQEQSIHVHPLFIYEQLREINPSPYMSYMQLGDMYMVSGSPELLIKKNGEYVSTRPIAGTRSRGKDDLEDQQLVDDLLQNEKEVAEHIMLVDLERNDLGRVCEYGSVEVDELMVVEKYSHVMHIVSNVIGKLRSDTSISNVVKAVFPGGTITGAPKIRTMEIIEELEPVKRGIYTGSIGWISFSGDMELNIVIRTMLVKNGVGYVQAGAGVVIDSYPEREYKESLKKARAIHTAIEQAHSKGADLS